jgi:hypothetical protein
MEATLQWKGRPFDEPTRKGIKEALSEIYSARLAPEDSPGKEVCSFCGKVPSLIGYVIARPPVRPDPVFEWESDFRKVPVARAGKVFCRVCLHHDFLQRDRYLELARSIAAGMDKAPQYLPMFDAIAGPRVVRRVQGATCSTCGRRGEALRCFLGAMCLRCHAAADALFRMQMRLEKDRTDDRERDYEGRVKAYLDELERMGREEARAVLAAREARARALGNPLPAPPKTAKTQHDAEAEQCIAFLDQEIGRAARYDSSDRDLIGDGTKIARVNEMLASKTPPRRDILEALLVRVSMLRNVMRTGVDFFDYTGDELINEVIGSYRSCGSFLDVGMSWYVPQAEAGPMLIVGGTAEKRRAAAYAISAVLRARDSAGWPYSGPRPFQFVEAEELWRMPQREQEEIRRRMLITPPDITIFGAESVDRFIEETPRRTNVRFATYFFMNGQEPLDLDKAPVYVSLPAPVPARPKRRG